MPFSCTARSVAEVPSAGRPAAGTSGEYDDFCRTLFCPEAVLFCQQQRLCHGPAGVRQLHCQLQVRSAQGTQPAGILQTTAGRRAGLARRLGLPPLRSSTRSMSRVSTGPGRFSSRAASTISILRCSGDGRRL